MALTTAILASLSGNVGVSNLTQVSVSKQSLLAVRRWNVRPKFIRADRGPEGHIPLDRQFNFHGADEVASGAFKPENSGQL